MKLKLFLYCLFLAVCLNMISCTTCCPPSLKDLEKSRPALAGFEQGISYCAKSIVSQLSDGSKIFLKIRRKSILINPFLVSETGRRLKFQKDIEQIFAQEMISCFKIVSSASKDTPDYILEGVIFYEKQTDDFNERIPRLYISVVDTNTQTVKAVVNQAFLKFDISPDDMDVNDPILGPDESQTSVIKTVQLAPGTKTPDFYPMVVDLRKNVDFGDAFFHEEQYDKAIEYYFKAIEKKEVLGEAGVERVYERLYQAFHKKGDETQAKFYRRKRILVRMASKKKIDIELHFKVDSDQFMEPETHQSRFLVESIAEYAKSASVCLAIFGHSSKTGSVWYNCGLSRMRAQAVKNIIVSILPNLEDQILIRGRSFLNCRYCQGENLPDRRVEFKVIDCEMFTSPEQVETCEKLAEKAGYVP